MTIDTAWTLCRITVRIACTDTAKIADVAAVKADVSRAQSMANELRHLTALMNHEKY